MDVHVCIHRWFAAPLRTLHALRQRSVIPTLTLQDIIMKPVVQSFMSLDRDTRDLWVVGAANALLPLVLVALVLLTSA